MVKSEKYLLPNDLLVDAHSSAKWWLWEFRRLMKIGATAFHDRGLRHPRLDVGAVGWAHWGEVLLVAVLQQDRSRSTNRTLV